MIPIPLATYTTSGVGFPLDLDEDPPSGRRYVALDVVVRDIVAADEPPRVILESASAATGPWVVVLDEPLELGPMRLAAVASDRYVRARWEVAAGDSVEMAATAKAQLLLATIDDFHSHGLPAGAVRNIATKTIAKALLAATATVLGKFSLRFDLPLSRWEEDTIEATCKIAAYNALSAHGFAPGEGDSDSNVLARRNHAMKWLDDVVDNHANPAGLVDATPDVEDDGVAVYSDPSRWGR